MKESWISETYSSVQSMDLASVQRHACGGYGGRCCICQEIYVGTCAGFEKRLDIHIIHDVERPMKDMMLGLENWIPLYMTGQIFPYYLKGGSE